MITLETADKALKTVYLGVIGNQLNTGANPLLSKIKQTTNNVYGNEIVKSSSFGVSGGVTAGPESDELPRAYNKKYIQFKTTLKNLYGTLEISDKAIRCSQNSASAFVNLLNDEMESLIQSSSFNLGRMLYGDGSGILAKVTADNEEADDIFTVDNVRNFAINLACRFVNVNGQQYSNYSPFVIKNIDKANSKISVDIPAEINFKNYKIATLKGLNNEITGLGAIFGDRSTIYSLSKTTYPWLNPYKKSSVGALTETAMQTAIDEINDVTGEDVDYIACSTKVRRAYQSIMNTYRRNIDVMDLQGGFKAITFNGIPLVADKFVADDQMYLLTTKNFEMCQLGDWEWLEGNDGRIIKQKDNYPVYTATLVKYAELLCGKPCAQALLSGITA